MRDRCAFTLIELLVVIAIVALLVGLLLPVLGSARASARAVKCLAGVRTIGQGVHLYAMDHGGRMPLSSYSTGNAFSSGNWVETLVDYGTRAEVRRCPDDPTVRQTSYVTNDYLEPAGGGFSRLVDIPAPSATAYAAEAQRNYLTDHLHAWLESWAQPQDMVSQIEVERHQGGSNLIYLDGHAAAKTWASTQAEFSAERNWFDPQHAR